VVVLANRTPAAVHFEVRSIDGESTSYSVPAGDVLPIPVDGDVTIRFGASRGTQKYELTPNSAYFFYDVPDKGLDLEQLGLHGHVARRPVDRAIERTDTPDIATVTVRIYVDEEERAATEAWTKRLTQRVEAASAIFEKYCRVRFKVVETGTWPSDNTVEDFQASLQDFERMVTAHPADLAIGFTSQYAELQAGSELGGTRAPFHPYVLIREGSVRISEPEKLEVLVHELGHYLGATHSPEPTSVMRPSKKHRRALLQSYHIGFDAVNTLIMSIISEEMRDGPVRALKDLNLNTRLELRAIYSTLAQTLPDDPAGPIYVRLLGIIEPITPLESDRIE